MISLLRVEDKIIRSDESLKKFVITSIINPDGTESEIAKLTTAVDPSEIKGGVGKPIKFDKLSSTEKIQLHQLKVL